MLRVKAFHPERANLAPELLLKLAAESDVFLTNYLPGASLQYLLCRKSRLTLLQPYLASRYFLVSAKAN